MRIGELLSMGRPAFSFEFFPPKTEAGLQVLRDSILSLRDLQPTFISVTYGAGGSARDRTMELLAEAQRKYEFEALAHLTCVGATSHEIEGLLQRLQVAGIENILALRGDPPQGQERFHAVHGGFAHADGLVAFIKRCYRFCVGGACYPEGHLECVGMHGNRDLDRDMANLKRKVDAGCQFLITQLFFDNQAYFDFVGRARKAGIGVPIIPGIMPITNFEQVQRFTQMCGATIPKTLLDELDRLKLRPDAVLSLGVAHAAAQCLELLQRNVPGIHFYTLNKSAATRTILTALRTIWPPAQHPA
ncbi:MAG: methylenetetrahydrofolate reductase [NAD(P)H] [Planctomycetota bacterium]